MFGGGVIADLIVFWWCSITAVLRCDREFPLLTNCIYILRITQLRVMRAEQQRARDDSFLVKYRNLYKTCNVIVVSNASNVNSENTLTQRVDPPNPPNSELNRTNETRVITGTCLNDEHFAPVPRVSG